MNWDVHLTFVEGSSNKFWRARVDGNRLFVNYGRIGSDGQTQIKDLDSPERCRRELESLAASKRKKGYEDVEAAAAEDQVDEEAEEIEEAEDEEEEERKPARAARSAPARPTATAKGKSAPAAVSQPAAQIADLTLPGERAVDLRLVCVGNMVRTVVVERYGSADDAAQAFERLRKAMAGEGYQTVAQRPDL